MERFVVFAVVVALVVVAAVVARRRRPQAPTQGRWPVPTQLDRDDFERPEAPWLVALFSSATCDSCAAARAQAAPLAGPNVAVDEIEVGARPDLHQRYGIEAVPIVVVADADGVVRASFAGPPPPEELRAVLARRDGPT